jgi:hypothetical protein
MTGIHWPATAATVSHGQLSNKSSTLITENCRSDTTTTWPCLCSILNNELTLWNEQQFRIREDNWKTLSRYACLRLACAVVRTLSVDTLNSKRRGNPVQ